MPGGRRSEEFRMYNRAVRDTRAQEAGMEKHSPAFNLLASRLTSNPDMGVGGTPVDIKDLCGKIKSTEKDALVSLMAERKKTLNALSANKDVKDIPKNLQDSYKLTLEAISAMYGYLGVEETDSST